MNALAWLGATVVMIWFAVYFIVTLDQTPLGLAALIVASFCLIMMISDFFSFDLPSAAPGRGGSKRQKRSRRIQKRRKGRR